jgi:hypothetical protein
MNLPSILATAISSAGVGVLVSLVGYYTPFMVLGAILSTIGLGLLSTLQVHSGPAQWIGYQVLYGIGTGLGLQQGWTVVQAALPSSDVPQATAIVTFAQTLSGALFISIGHNIFQNELVKNVHANAPGVDVGLLIQGGPTTLRDIVAPDMLSIVLQDYSNALTHSFYVAVATGTLCLIGAFSVEFKSVKGRKLAVRVS